MKADSSKITGLVATVVIHALVVLLLLTVVMQAPAHPDESGMEVTLGDVDLAKGAQEDYRLTEVKTIQPEIAPTPEAIENTAPPVPEEPIIAQETEETVVIETAEQIEARKKAEAEKKAADAAAAAMANAFGKSSEMTAKGSAEQTAQAGTQGAVIGNPESASKASEAGKGHANVDGWDVLGELPLPVVDNVPFTATVMIDITIDSQGNVIEKSLHRGKPTNTADSKLINAALAAASKAKFTLTKKDDIAPVESRGNIIYYFILK